MASDCTGYNAAKLALENLFPADDVREVFASDIDEHAWPLTLSVLPLAFATVVSHNHSPSHSHEGGQIRSQSMAGSETSTLDAAPLLIREPSCAPETDASGVMKK